MEYFFARESRVSRVIAVLLSFCRFYRVSLIFFRICLFFFNKTGHYMGWVRQEGDDWLVFDDADVSPCKTEDIMNLKGGGDWHMAYLTFYRFKD